MNRLRNAELPGATGISTLADALAFARSVAPSLPLNSRVLDFLYRRTRCAGISRAEWESEVRLASAIDRTLRWSLPSAMVEAVASVDRGSRAIALAQVTETPPTMAIGYHGSFPPLRTLVFADLFPDNATIGIGEARDGAYALLAVREAMLDGKPVLFAPDGWYGKEASLITVLGAQRPVADGAPFLAHLTGCKVLWFGVLRTDKGFTLDIAEGPRREEGEPFAEYRERFYGFFARQIEASLTGDPRSITLSGWQRTFVAMLAGTVDRYTPPAR